MLSFLNSSLDGDLQTDNCEVNPIRDEPPGEGAQSPETPDDSKPRRPTFLAIKKHARPAAEETQYIPCMCSPHSVDEGERLVRRVSYLKATSGERMYTDSDAESDGEDKHSTLSSASAAWRAVGGTLSVSELPSPASLQSSVVKQGSLHVKLTRVDGKRAGDRSWKAVWAVVQGRALFFYKDKQHAIQTPLGAEDQISLRGSQVTVASDYTKRRHVLRLSTPGGSQLLLQADSQPTMTAWLTSLHHTAASTEDSSFIPPGENIIKSSSTNCLTPTTASSSVETTTTTTTTSTSLSASSYSSISNNNSQANSVHDNNVSPQTSSKALRKMTSSLRTRSPTGQSPSSKTRKATGDTGSSPKSKTWRGRIGRHLKKIHGGSPATTPSTPLPEGATIGVCLEDCPQSAENECLPLLVSLCVGVVETRGLHTQGIYRIPGNKAAVTYLTETINRGPKAIDLSDPKWSDVNVISSLLKHFFQKLPDPLITSDLYSQFIQASKIEEPKARLVELKNLVQELPDHHYETLRYLCFHLRRIVDLSEDNKMGVKNLAIVFGPTLVRTADDNMAKMVTDMSHQCRIVETLITHVHWIFSDDEDGYIPPPSPVSNHPLLQSPMGDSLGLPSEAETPLAQALLLHNIPKMEANKGDSKKILVSSIISAANRKVQKVRPKRTEEEPVSVSVPENHSSNDLNSRGSSDVDLRKDYRVELPDPLPMSHRKVSSMSLGSVQEQPPANLPAATSSSAGDLDHREVNLNRDENFFYSADKGKSSDSRLDSSISEISDPVTTVPAISASSSSIPRPLYDTSFHGDEVAIRSYTGLSANTQERIRRFEQETRAMLQRDVTRHRRESKKWEVDRKKLEEEWYRAKCDLESDDILDQLADNPSEMVQKMSAYSWRSSRDGGEGQSLATQSSSSDGALISPALSRHSLIANNSHSVNTGSTNNKTKVYCSSNNMVANIASTNVVDSCSSPINSSIISTNSSSDLGTNTNFQNKFGSGLIQKTKLNFMSTGSKFNKGNENKNTEKGSDKGSSKQREILSSETYCDYGTLGSTSSSGTSDTCGASGTSDYGSLSCNLDLVENSMTDSSVGHNEVFGLDLKNQVTNVPVSSDSLNSNSSEHSLSVSPHSIPSTQSFFVSVIEATANILTKSSMSDQTDCATLKADNAPSNLLSIPSKTNTFPSLQINEPTNASNEDSKDELKSPISNASADSCNSLLNTSANACNSTSTSSSTNTSISSTSLLSLRRYSNRLNGRQKDTIFHHILPCGFHPSPRPMRRGSSAESINYTLLSTSCSTSNLPIARSSTLHNVYSHKWKDNTMDNNEVCPEHGLVRRGSLDSLNDAPSHTSQDDGSDLLSAITATFEEKMRSLQESHMTEAAPSFDNLQQPSSHYNIRNNKLTAMSKVNNVTREGNSCRLYRDPSLHRRRISQSSAGNLEFTGAPTTFVEKNNSENTRNHKFKGQDSYLNSEMKDSCLKEKSEKRIRDPRRTEPFDNAREKKPKEMRIALEDDNIPINEKELLQLYNDDAIGILGLATELRSRRHNVKELKEKFEQGNNSKSNSENSRPSSKKPTRYNRKNNQKSSIKRRHTVGGTKDLAKQAWIQLIGATQYNNLSAMIQNLSTDSSLTSLSAWEHLQPLIADPKLKNDGALETWSSMERMRTSSPDLSRLLALVLPPFVNEREVLHRRRSVRESILKPLYPVLESHV